MNLPGWIRLGAGLSAMALLAIVTIHTTYWYNLPEISSSVMIMILVAFFGSIILVMISLSRGIGHFRHAKSKL